MMSILTASGTVLVWDPILVVCRVQICTVPAVDALVTFDIESVLFTKVAHSFVVTDYGFLLMTSIIIIFQFLFMCIIIYNYVKNI